MVTLLKDYEQQTYFLNTADDITDIVFHNGDQVFLMDQDLLLIYDESANNWYPVPTGGGGGTTPTILSLLASGTYTKVSGNNMAIPISLPPGTKAMVLGVYNPNVSSGTAQTVANFKVPIYSLEGFSEELTLIPGNKYTAGIDSKALVRLANDTYQFNSSVTSVYLNYYSAEYATTLTFERASSSYPLPNTTYKWLIWGL